MEVTLTFVDQKNASHTLTCNGILARCTQHEIDHLNGKLHTDSMSQKDRKRFVKYLAECRSEAQSSERDDGDS
jgi:peptide deformylase